MADKRATKPNLAQCFGHYQQQSVTYALDVCLGCSKLKACVRTAWGVERPVRTRRGAWDGGARVARATRPPWPSSVESLAT